MCYHYTNTADLPCFIRVRAAPSSQPLSRVESISEVGYTTAQWTLTDLNRGPSGYEPDALTG